VWLKAFIILAWLKAIRIESNQCLSNNCFGAMTKRYNAMTKGYSAMTKGCKDQGVQRPNGAMTKGYNGL